MEYAIYFACFIAGAVVAVLVLSQRSRAVQSKILSEADERVEKVERAAKAKINELEAKAKKAVKPKRKKK